MRIVVKAKPNSKKSLVEKLTETQLPFMKDTQEVYNVYVTAPPIDGKANEAIINLLRDYFGVPKSSVELISGDTSKIKIFEIKNNYENI